MAVTNISGFGGDASGLDAFDQLMNYKKKTAKKSTTPVTPGLQSPFSSIGLDLGTKTAATEQGVSAPAPIREPVPETDSATSSMILKRAETGADDQGFYNITASPTTGTGGKSQEWVELGTYTGLTKRGEGDTWEDWDQGKKVTMKYSGGKVYKLVGMSNKTTPADTHQPETMQITQDNWNYWKRHLESLGYDISNTANWIGKTIATGYWSPVSVQGVPNPEEDKVYPGQDGNLYTFRGGEWFKYTIEKDLSNVSSKLNEMQNVAQPDLYSYDDAIAGLQNALTQMPTSEDLYSASQEAAARRLGFANADEMYQTQGDMFGQMQGGIGNGDLTVTQQRQTNMESQRMREDYKKIIESLNASGRSVAALQQADQFVSAIADQRLKSTLEYENLNFAQRQAEYSALSQRWDALFKNGSIAAQEYLDSQTKYWTDYISGYATMIGAISEANQGMLQAQAQHAQIIYSGILAELGVDAQALELSNQLFEEYLAPYYKMLEEKGLNAQINAASAEQGMSLAGMILGTLGSVLGALAGGPAGAVAGATAGASAG